MTQTSLETAATPDARRACDAPDTQAVVRDVLSRVGDRWSLLTIDRLADGPSRFGRLQERLPGISHRVLTVTLRQLQRDGLVSRAAYAEVPPRVEYALTDLGRAVLEPVEALIAWAQRHQEDIVAARARYDAGGR
ncbi:transcriptional regulator [Xylanimonas oleitrophica]|uniref:Transcriptional regulator n=1 Tax=Xylanimonas oleitrophica TaxID=2607479 RepID=A0A2W5WNB0_9MICO|nr:helix-turn-helix domain-containing protein [Xylanimonas oleitrophica]PZR52233.1 transcriptional regulator [Xylanimonas oleitrophica]